MGRSILLVDDDRILVEKVEQTVHWAELGITTVLTANNIRQAQRILTACPVDVILCDIDMPQGSGLELLEWVRRNKLPARCIFLSSYANFSYAQKAIRLATSDYLLKPIASEDLEKSIRRAVEELPGAVSMQESSGREAFWNALLTGGDAGEEPPYAEDETFVLLQIRMLSSHSKEADPNRPQMQELWLRTHLEPEALVNTGEGEYVAVLKGDAEVPTLQDDAEEKACIWQVHAGAVREMPDKLALLKHMTSQLAPCEALIFTEDDLTKPALRAEDFPWKRWRRMLTGPEPAEQLAREMCDQFHQKIRGKRLPVATLTECIREFDYLLSDYFHMRGLTFDQVFGQTVFAEREEEAGQSLESFLHFLSWVLDTVEGNRQMEPDMTETLKSYIEEHLGEDLSRKALSARVFLSEDYISKRFAQDTGMTLSGYITARRIERAKEYLEHTTKKVGRIALDVGYNNFSYFSKTFRDLTGHTPNEYRAQFADDRIIIK